MSGPTGQLLIDEFLPSWSFAETHSIEIEAPPEVVYDCVRSLDFGDSVLVRLLFWLRGAPGLLSRLKDRRRSALGLTIGDLQRFGFVLLGEAAGEEMLLGLVGQFWRPTGNIRRIDSAQFKQFTEPGFAKAAWNFHLAVLSASRVLLRTETRILCMDEISLKRFSAYWRRIRPFSGLVRKDALRIIRNAAQRHTNAPA